MSAPFDLGLSFLPTPTGTAGQPTGMSMPDSFGGGFLGGLVNSLPGLLTGLAQAGVIRGSVGNFLAPMQANPVGMSPTFATNLVPLPPAPPTGGGSLLEQAMRALQAIGGAGQAVQTVSNFFPGGGSGGSCGSRVQPVVQAPSLFRMNACGGTSPVSRVQVMGPNGAIYVFQNLGRATRGSNEARVARRLARDNGFTLGRRGGAALRRRRRPR